MSLYKPSPVSLSRTATVWRPVASHKEVAVPVLVQCDGVIELNIATQVSLYRGSDTWVKGCFSNKLDTAGLCFVTRLVAL